jgi:hypothetical protein
MSSAAARLNGKSGIFGCGFNRKYANSLGLKFGDLAIVAKGGTSALALLIGGNNMASSAPSFGEDQTMLRVGGIARQR